MNSIHVVIINGKPCAGKDEFVKQCHVCLYNHCECVNISSVDIHKQILRKIGWDGKTKSDDVRELLCRMKEFSILHGDIPTKYMLDTIFSYIGKGSDCVIFCHIREVAEIKKLIRALRGLRCMGITYSTVFIRREDKIKSLNKDACCASDDVDIEDFDYDFIIDNFGTLNSLKNKASRFINYLIGENGNE